MYISIFEIFKIGIGPSSSHTVGPIKAANEFVTLLTTAGILEKVAEVKVELYGSLALTGRGHGTDKAIVIGLMGEHADTVDPDTIPAKRKAIEETGQLLLGGTHAIPFKEANHILFHFSEMLPKHTNGLRFTAYGANKQELINEIYYSVGGGFVVTDAQFGQPPAEPQKIPYSFTTADELLTLCRENNLSISELMMANEKVFHTESEVKERLLRIVAIMEACLKKGCQTEGTLPGGLKVQRRGAALYKKLVAEHIPRQQHYVMNWLNAYAMAVNEENAAGGRVVTAPTNGAAGIIPAVLQYYKEFCDSPTDDGMVDFLLTAGAIAILYKLQGSISGAEVGCQGEVGVACSMAAGALAAVLGGTLLQVECAAEIGMEHNLGLTCDPPKGLVQIPCIERNAMGAVKAVNAAGLALAEDGSHKIISLGTVIEVMRQTGRDMKTSYKETSLGGLAVNIPEC